MVSWKTHLKKLLLTLAFGSVGYLFLWLYVTGNWGSEAHLAGIPVTVVFWIICASVANIILHSGNASLLFLTGLDCRRYLLWNLKSHACILIPLFFLGPAAFAWFLWHNPPPNPKWQSFWAILNLILLIWATPLAFFHYLFLQKPWTLPLSWPIPLVLRFAKIGCIFIIICFLLLFFLTDPTIAIFSRIFQSLYNIPVIGPFLPIILFPMGAIPFIHALPGPGPVVMALILGLLLIAILRDLWSLNLSEEKAVQRIIPNIRDHFQPDTDEESEFVETATERDTEDDTSMNLRLAYQSDLEPEEQLIRWSQSNRVKTPGFYPYIKSEPRLFIAIFGTVVMGTLYLFHAKLGVLSSSWVSVPLVVFFALTFLPGLYGFQQVIFSGPPSVPIRYWKLAWLHFKSRHWPLIGSTVLFSMAFFSIALPSLWVFPCLLILAYSFRPLNYTSLWLVEYTSNRKSKVWDGILLVGAVIYVFALIGTLLAIVLAVIEKQNSSWLLIPLALSGLNLLGSLLIFLLSACFARKRGWNLPISSHTEH